MNSFEQHWIETAGQIDSYIKSTLPAFTAARSERMGIPLAPGLKKLLESMEYSTYSGGKRFRPVLCLWSLEALGCDMREGLAFAAAIEFIHCYSLIHDDLPCMDNDDFRRGKPSNHKVYGEAIALLAGSTLLTESFSLVAQNYKEDLPKQLVDLLACAAGFSGMAGGQAIDILKSNKITQSDLETLHALKTGAMIRVASQGAACIAGASQEQTQNITEYAKLLGHAFQVADDLLDHDPQKPEAASYPAVLGVEETKSYLKKLTDEAIEKLQGFGSRAKKLEQMALYNLQRKS